MKRAGVTLACVLGLSWASAAAAAPKPFDFELRGPVGAVAAGGPYRSPALRTPRRFDLVGLRWRGAAVPAISLRAKKPDGRWTKWTRVPADPDDSPDRGSRERGSGGFSAPVWTGDADYVQYRLSRRVPGLRLHFVGVPAATRRALAARRAQAAPGAAPPVQPRAAWGAEDCAPRGAPEYGDVQVAFIHHTVSANDYTAAEVPSIILSICRYHRNSNGWNDIGYNFLVDKFGTLWEGRAGGIDQPVIGAQAQGYNSRSTGIAEIGTHSDVPAAPAALDAMARLIRWKLPLHGAPTQGTVTLTSGGGSVNRYALGTPVTFERIAGHRNADNTTCPGNALYAQLPELRDRVGDVQPAQARTRLDVALTPGAVVYPRQATVSGALRQLTGAPVANAPLEVQALGASGWRTTWRATTGSDGGFRADVGAQLSHRIRVRFAGDDLRLGAVSGPVLLKVVPELTLQRSAARRAVGETVTLSGTVQPDKTRLQLVVERRAGKRRSTGTLSLRARRGRFARTYRFDSSGLFRFHVKFAGDEGNAASRSPAVYVRALPALAAAPGSGSGGVSAEAAGRRR